MSLVIWYNKLMGMDMDGWYSLLYGINFIIVCFIDGLYCILEKTSHTHTDTKKHTNT